MCGRQNVSKCNQDKIGIAINLFIIICHHFQTHCKFIIRTFFANEEPLCNNNSMHVVVTLSNVQVSQHFRNPSGHRIKRKFSSLLQYLHVYKYTSDHILTIPILLHTQIHKLFFFGVVEQGRAFVILVREGDGYKGVKLKQNRNYYLFKFCFNTNILCIIFYLFQVSMSTFLFIKMPAMFKQSNQIQILPHYFLLLRALAIKQQ